MKSKGVLVCVCLLGCQDFSFDYFGRPANSAQKPPPNLSFGTTGEVVTCTNDSQCGNEEFFCYKNSDNYVGVCAQIGGK